VPWLLHLLQFHCHSDENEETAQTCLTYFQETCTCRPSLHYLQRTDEMTKLSLTIRKTATGKMHHQKPIRQSRVAHNLVETWGKHLVVVMEPPFYEEHLRR